MFAAPFLKPASDPRTAAAFATDNFAFCMKTLGQSTLQLALAPFLAVFGNQVSIGGMITQILEAIQGLLAALYAAFLSFIDPFLRRFQAVTYQAGIVTQHLRTAFQRVNTILTSFIFVGLSTMQGLENLIDTVINIILIICGIMLAIIIILFFILFPLIPLIITTLTIILAVGIGTTAAAAENMKGGFCFDPETPIVLKSGLTRPISELHIGEELANGEYVEGILVLEGSQTPLYNLQGIRVSGSHLVKDEQGLWRAVETDPRAVPISERSPILYCLNTTNQIIPVYNRQMGSVLQFRDWEEIGEEDKEGQQEWDLLIRSMLGMDLLASCSETFCLMSPATQLSTHNRGPICLDKVGLGDLVEDDTGVFTRVIGLVKGRIGCGEGSDWVSACIQKEGGTWVRRTTTSSGPDTIGYHLITESGTFRTKQGLFRDFTEVGADRIQDTYSFVASRLNFQS